MSFSELRKKASDEWPHVENLRRARLEEIRKNAEESISLAIEDKLSSCLVAGGMEIKEELEQAGFYVERYIGKTARISWEG